MDLIAFDPATLSAFVLASVLMEITPGPNMAYLAILSISDGRRAGYAAVAGVATGLLIVGLAAALGVAAAIGSSPLAYQLLRWGGVGYLFWLAWQGWRDAQEASEHAAQGSGLARFFGRGLLTNLLNPKAFAFYVAVLPGFISIDRPVVPQAVTLSLLFVAIATTIHLGIVSAADSSRRFLADDRRRVAVRRVLSVLLGFVAIWLAVRTAG